MPYETLQTISIAVKEGPTVQQKGPLDNVVATNAKKLRFLADDPADKLCKQLGIPLEEGERIAFIAVKASKYVFKECVNVDKSGVGLKLISKSSEKLECRPAIPVKSKCSPAIVYC